MISSIDKLSTVSRLVRSCINVTKTLAFHAIMHSTSEKALGASAVTNQIFSPFEQVRIINLVDRPDRRAEMLGQMRRLGGMAPNMSFYEAHRPPEAHRAQ